MAEDTGNEGKRFARGETWRRVRSLFLPDREQVHPSAVQDDRAAVLPLLVAHGAYMAYALQAGSHKEILRKEQSEI